MPGQISSKLKKLQADIQGSKELPGVVADVQKEVLRLNHFVKSFFKKENELILSKEVQMNVLEGLVDVNRLLTQLSQNCRSDHHFQLYRAQFLQMKQMIQDLVFCVNLSIENGFYEFETRGFRLLDSLVLSWQGVQEIHEGITQTTGGKYLPYVLKHNSQLKRRLHSLYETLVPLAATVLEFKKTPQLSDFFTLEELKVINRFFKQIQVFHQTIEKQYLNRSVTNEILNKLHIEEIDQIFKELHHLEHNTHRYASGTESFFLMDPLHFDETTTNDLHARMNAIHVQLEASRVLVERRQTVKDILSQEASLEAMAGFSRKIDFEKKQLKFFIKNFSRIDQSLLGVSSILSDLSVSFGKIFHLSLKSDLTKEFLIRVLQTAHNLLTKSIKFAEARKTDSQQLQLALQKATIFQKAVKGMIFSAFRELENAKQQIINYDQKLMKKLAQAAKQKRLSPSMIQNILEEAYEDRTELNTAAIYLHNISNNFELLVKELKAIDVAFQQFYLEFSNEEEAQHVLEKVLHTLDKAGQCPPELMQNLWMSVQHLHWYIEDIILENLRENRRFQKDFEKFIAPVKERIEERKIQKKLEKTKPVLLPKLVKKSPAKIKAKKPSPDIVIPKKSSPDIVIPKKPSPDIVVPERPSK